MTIQGPPRARHSLPPVPTSEAVSRPVDNRQTAPVVYRIGFSDIQARRLQASIKAQKDRRQAAALIEVLAEAQPGTLAAPPDRHAVTAIVASSRTSSAPSH